MKTVLITGANRGLGLGMVKYLTKQNTEKTIIATCRTVSEKSKKPMTRDEVSYFVELIQNCPILTSKETNASSNKLKDEAWASLAAAFNAKCGGFPKQKEQLKLKWDNLKKAARKRTQQIRMNRLKELKTLSADNKNVIILNLDVKNTASFGDFSTEVSKVVGNQGLNLLINNAGVSTKFTKLPLVKAEQLLDNLTVNTIAPIMLTKILLPILKQAADANSSKPMGGHRAAVINMSSILGSIAQNDQGGFYPYRCSKAALNAASKSMSVDLKKDNILVASMHPGWVKTDMGGKNAHLDVETSVSQIFKTIDKLAEPDTGKFLNYDGTELPW